MAALPLRDDFDAERCRAAARRSKDGAQTRRLLSIAAIYEGSSRAEAARLGGVTAQIVRDWVERFNQEGPEGLVDRKAPGKAPLLGPDHLAALARRVDEGPIPSVHGVVRWRIVDLAQWLYEEFRIAASEDTVSRALRKMGYRKLSARPRHHAQDTQAIEDFKKVSPPAWTKSPPTRASRPMT